MKKNLLPKQLPNTSESIYAGFWIRLAAKLLDLLIMLPVTLLILYVNGISKTAYYEMIAPNLLFVLFYEIYLVQRFGGTPGKMILGIKILKLDGDKVDYKNASLRYLVTIIITIISTFVMLNALNGIQDELYNSLGFLSRNKLIGEMNPTGFKCVNWINFCWAFGSFIVLIANKRSRAIHDFIAGTIVVKAIYIEKINEFKESENEF